MIRAFLLTLTAIDALLDGGGGVFGHGGELVRTEAPDLGFDQQNSGDLYALLAGHTVFASVAEPASQLVADLFHLLPVVQPQGPALSVITDNFVNFFLGLDAW